MESNIKIKATVPEMSEFFEKDNGVRHYEIKDKRYTQAELDAMPEDKYNSEVFAFSVCYRHMELEKPLTGTFTIAGLTEKMDAFRAANSRLHTPVYKNDAEYAIEHDELPAYRESFRVNMACRDALEAAIHESYHDYCLDTGKAAAQVAAQFGMERVAYVLANTVRAFDHDGRISRDNKAWAQTVPVCTDTDEWGHERSRYFLVSQVNPGLVDLLVSRVREELAKEKDAPEKRPSVLKKIQKNKAAIQAKTAEKKLPGQER